MIFDLFQVHFYTYLCHYKIYYVMRSYGEIIIPYEISVHFNLLEQTN